MKLIVGLGNPGKDYENTRHNVGFMILDKYLDDDNWKEKYNALYQSKNICGEKVLFLKPLTFMNLSGDAVVKYMNYYNISIDDIFIIHDDLDLNLGSYKIKKDSSAGGHNGIKSIINRLKSQKFARLKVGISKNNDIDTKDYVLGKFNKSELEIIESMQNQFNEIINMFIKDGIEKTMNVYNTKK